MDRSEKEDAQRHQFIQHRGARRSPLIDQMKQSVRRRLADEVADVLVQISLTASSPMNVAETMTTSTTKGTMVNAV